MSNRYIQKVKSKTVKDLEKIVQNHEDYEKDLVLAAISELEFRGGEVSESEGIKERIKEKEAKEAEREKHEFERMPNGIWAADS